MKYIGNWKAWEKGDVKRIYLADDKYFEEGVTGLCSQSGTFTTDEIAFANKIIGNKTFAELFAEIKASNSTSKANKKNVAALKKERDALLASAKTEEERDAIFAKYVKLIKAAKYA